MRFNRNNFGCTCTCHSKSSCRAANCKYGSSGSAPPSIRISNHQRRRVRAFREASHCPYQDHRPEHRQAIAAPPPAQSASVPRKRRSRARRRQDSDCRERTLTPTRDRIAAQQQAQQVNFHAVAIQVVAQPLPNHLPQLAAAAVQQAAAQPLANPLLPLEQNQAHQAVAQPLPNPLPPLEENQAQQAAAQPLANPLPPLEQNQAPIVNPMVAAASVPSELSRRELARGRFMAHMDELSTFMKSI